MEVEGVRRVVWLNWVVVIIAGKVEEGAPMVAMESSRIPRMGSLLFFFFWQEREPTRWIEAAMELCPMTTAYGAGHITMSDIGGDTNKVENIGTLGCEYSLPRTDACAVVPERI